MEDILNLDDNVVKFEDDYRGMMEAICKYCKETYDIHTLNHSFKAKLVGSTYEPIFNFWMFSGGVDRNIKELCYKTELKKQMTEIYVKIHYIDGEEGMDQLAKKVGHTAMIAMFDLLSKYEIPLS